MREEKEGGEKGREGGWEVSRERGREGRAEGGWGD